MNGKRILMLKFFIFLSLCCSTVFAKPIICQQAYALCTKGHCVLNPKNNKETICDCEVKTGASVGMLSCSARAPRKDHHETHLVSTFSLADFANTKSLKCPQGSAFSMCLDVACTVDKSNPKARTLQLQN